MNFQIKNRFTGAVQYECELPIEAEKWHASLQLGFAVKKAVKAGADLTGADLTGANVIDAGHRSDGYRFIAVVNDGVLMITAGCRYFTIDQAREHWTSTRAGTLLGEESLAMLDHLERMARIRGLVEGAR